MNVGTTKIAQKLGKVKYYKYMRDFGFGELSNVGLPGETNGLLRATNNWSAVDIGMISFGQGIGVSALQMVSAYATIANSGTYLEPTIIDYIEDSKNVTFQRLKREQPFQVVSERTAQQVAEMLVKVVDSGTGINARIPGFSVAGKTGTAQVPKRMGLGMKKEYIKLLLLVFSSIGPEVRNRCVYP